MSHCDLGPGYPATTPQVQPAHLTVASELLAEAPFSRVTLEQVRDRIGGEPAHGVSQGITMRDIASQILDYERQFMKTIQGEAASQSDPIGRILTAFRLVGAHLDTDIIVRAGVRLASESREYFPERRLDPYSAWEKFIVNQVEIARVEKRMRLTVDSAALSRLIVHAGIGTKDFIFTHKTWSEASHELETTLICVLRLAGFAVEEGDRAIAPVTKRADDLDDR